MAAYEEMIRATSTKHAPWHVVPADHKWFTQLAVAATIVESPRRVSMSATPCSARRERRRLARLRRALLKT
jgi:hypothetical protein